MAREHLCRDPKPDAIARRTEHPAHCGLAGVSRASFYRNWEEREPTAAEMELRDTVQRLALAHRYYGYRRIVVLLDRGGFVVGAKKVRRLMRQDNLLAIRRRKFAVTTDSDHTFQEYPNLAQHLELTDINQLWVADITYVRLEQEFVYLAVVLDAYSRRVIGWALNRTVDSGLAVEALDNRNQGWCTIRIVDRNMPAQSMWTG